MACPYRSQVAACPFARALIAQHGEDYAMEVFHSMKGEVAELHRGVQAEPQALGSLLHGPDGPLALERADGEKNGEAAMDEAPRPARSLPLAIISLGGAFGPFFRFDPFRRRPARRREEGREMDRGEPASHEAAGAGEASSGRCPLRGVYEPVVAALGAMGMQLRNLKCPAPIVAMRAAVAKTPVARGLRQQVLPTKLLAVAAMAAVVNIPFGMAREHTQKFSWQWFVAVHASIPFVGIWRKATAIPKFGIAFTIGAAILGQAIGAHIERSRVEMMQMLEEAEGGGGVPSTSMGKQRGRRCRDTPCRRRCLSGHDLPPLIGRPLLHTRRVVATCRHGHLPALPLGRLSLGQNHS